MWHCTKGFNFDVCARCWDSVHGPQEINFKFEMTREMFEQFMGRVVEQVEEWEDDEDTRLAMPLDSWKRRLLVFDGDAKSLTWINFALAKTKYDDVVVGRLTGFETVGVRSSKGPQEYVLWSTDLDVMAILNPPQDSWFSF